MDVRMCGFERRTPVDEALRILEERIQPLGAERVPVGEAAGRVAAADVVAKIAVPHFARSMMDGYAVVAEATLGASEYRPRALRVVGEVRAGQRLPLLRLAPDEALRVTTGAAMPDGADAVVMAELTSPGTRTDEVLVVEAVSPAKHVGPVGEDFLAGAAVVARGRRLRPQDAAALAATGHAEVLVVRRPRVRVVVTGDELLAPGSVAEGTSIVDTNGILLEALVERDGALLEASMRLRDDRAALRRAIADGEADVVLVAGGSSVGPEDHAPLVLAELGELAVHGVAMRPSSPAGFGFVPRAAGATAVFLLPGNPVSCLCGYEFFAGPAIRALGGRSRAWPHRRVTLPAAAKLVSQLGRTDYMRVAVGDDGVRPIMTSGASILSSTTRADGVVIIDDGCEGYAEGEAVEVRLYDEERA